MVRTSECMPRQLKLLQSTFAPQKTRELWAITQGNVLVDELACAPWGPAGIVVEKQRFCLGARRHQPDRTFFNQVTAPPMSDKLWGLTAPRRGVKWTAVRSTYLSLALSMHPLTSTRQLRPLPYCSISGDLSSTVN